MRVTGLPPPPHSQPGHYEWFKKAWSSDYEYDNTDFCPGFPGERTIEHVSILLVNALMKID